MKFDMRWVIVAAIIGVLWMMSSQVPKLSVADVEGKPCAVDTDCPCMGTYNYTTTGISAFGIGVGSCELNTTTQIKSCNMDYCYGLEPVGQWMVDNPLAWMKDSANIGWVLLIAALALMLLFWPKR